MYGLAVMQTISSFMTIKNIKKNNVQNWYNLLRKKMLSNSWLQACLITAFENETYINHV